MIVRESADTLCSPGTYFGPGECMNSKKIGAYDDKDAHAFGIDRAHARMKVGKAGKSHAHMDKEYEKELGYDEDLDNAFEGRLWKNHKIISFWEYPKPEHLEKIIRSIERELKQKEGINLNIWDDPEWRIETMISPIDGKPSYQSKMSPIFPMPYTTILQKFKDYGGSVDIDKIEHQKSPMEREKREVPPGFGSKHPKYQERGQWRRAKPFESLVPESLEQLLEFERSGNVMKGVGIGVEGRKEEIKDEIGWRIEDDQWQGPGMLKFKSYDLKEIWDSHPNDERTKIAIKEILEEWLSGKKKWRSGNYFYHLKDILYELGLLFDPKYKVLTPSTWESIISRSFGSKYNFAEEAREYALEHFKPNQLYSIGVNNRDLDMMKEGIKRGATNLGIGGPEVFEIPLHSDDGELLQLLLDRSPHSPEEIFGAPSSVTRYQRGGWSDEPIRDESNRALRMAAKYGKPNTFKVLFNDPRSNPSATNNFALKWAVKGGHWDIVDILLRDKRVQEKLHLLPKTTQSILKSRGLMESVQFERGKDPKEGMKIGSSALVVHRCGQCGKFGDEEGETYVQGTPAWNRAQKISEMPGSKTEHFTCEDCMEEMIYHQEMEAQARQAELEAQAEAEAEWRAAQEDDYHGGPYGY